MNSCPRDCFFPLISLRFRRTLEPHINPNPQQHRRKGLKASGNLLIGLSGGLGSSVLLDMIQKTYLSPRERQQGDQNPNGITCPWSKIFVVYVDISGIMIGVREFPISWRTICLICNPLYRSQMKALLSNNLSKDTVQQWNIYVSNLRTHLTRHGHLA